MKIAFLGDLHGRVFHALALVTTWQEKHGEKLDMVIQVGDMGGHSLQAMIKTETRTLEFVMDDWLADFHGDIDFVAFVEEFSSHSSAS